MQSEKSGTVSWILRELVRLLQPIAALTTSTNHSPQHVVDNVLEKYKSLQIYFNSSSKREKLLEYVVSKIMR